MEDIIKQITDAGIRTDAAKTPTFNVKPQYRGNFGFYHIISESWEIVFIKGVYRDNIREIKGSSGIPDKKLNELAQMLTDAERCLRKPAEIAVAYEEELFYIVSASTTIMPSVSADIRDEGIPAPVTTVELSLGKTESANKKHLFSKNPFTSVFGDVLSPVAYSILEALPEILSPLFMSAEIKTQSPSIKTFFGRVYANIDNFETIMSGFSAKPDMMYMSFLPSIYNKLAKPSVGVPKLSALKMQDDEIVQAMAEIDESVAALDRDGLLSEEFFEIIGLSVMVWEMIYMNLWHSFAAAHKAIGSDMDTTLRHLYKTCPAGLLESGQEIMPYLDPMFAPVRINQVMLEKTQSEDLYKTLSGSRRLFLSKNKYSELLANFHKYIAMRDRMFVIISKGTMKVRELLLAAGDKLQNDNIISNREDIFFFEMKEINNIVKDEFFGNIPFTLNFRKWQTARFAAMCLPNYLFEKDVAEYYEISDKQFSTSKDTGTVPCLGFFHSPLESDNYLCRAGISPASIQETVGKDAVIVESASVFSHIMQYCAVTDTPLYTGARFSPMLLKGRKIKTEKDKITMI